MCWTSFVGKAPGFAGYESILVKGFQLYEVQIGISSFIIFSWVATHNDEICISSKRMVSPPKTMTTNLHGLGFSSWFCKPMASWSLSSEVFLFLFIIYSKIVQQVLLNLRLIYLSMCCILSNNFILSDTCVLFIKCRTLEPREANLYDVDSNDVRHNQHCEVKNR